MSWISTRIEVADRRGEHWTFDIQLSRDSRVISSSRGELGSLGRVAMQALLLPDQSPCDRARAIIETFNLIVLSGTRAEIVPEIIERAVTALSAEIDFLDSAARRAG